MEYGVSKYVKEQSDLEMTIKKEVEETVSSTAYIDIEIDLNHVKQEPGLVQFVTSEPTFIIKKELLEDSKQDGNEQQNVQSVSTPAGTGVVNEACGSSLGHLLDVKDEPKDIDIGPTVLQPMDLHYTINQVKQNARTVTEENTNRDNFNKPMPSNRVKKKSVEDKLRDPEDGNYSCDKCMKTFQSKRVFMNHCRYMHGTERYKCTECDKEFKWKPYLQNHISNMHSNKQYECDICNKVFKSSQAVSRHAARIHVRRFPGVIYKCDQCPKTYPSKKSLRRHGILLHSKSPHKCTVCNKEFICKNYLDGHIRRVHFECDVCKKMCKSRESLSDHVLKHHHKPAATGSNAQTYSCDLCQKTFWTKRGIREHIESVHGARIHRCLKCNKNFKNLRYLQYHSKVIHGKVKLECELCQRRFKTKQNLNDHCRRIHSSKDM